MRKVHIPRTRSVSRAAVARGVRRIEGGSSRKSFVARNNELACVLNPDEVQNEIDEFNEEMENTVDPFQMTIC